MSAYASNPEPLWRSPSFRKLVIASAASHGLLGAGMFVAPFADSSPMRPPPIQVQVVPSIPDAPAPEPAAAPAPPPRQVVEEAVVIPEVPRAKPKPKPKDPEPPREKPKPEEPPPSAADLMAALRKDVEAREPALEPSEQGQDSIDPEVAAYMLKAKNCMTANWVGAREFQRRRDLFVKFDVRISASGVVESTRLIQGSGIRMLDETAEKAILKCSPLAPPPGDVRVFPFTFKPGDVE